MRAKPTTSLRVWCCRAGVGNGLKGAGCSPIRLHEGASSGVRAGVAAQKETETETHAQTETDIEGQVQSSGGSLSCVGPIASTDDDRRASRRAADRGARRSGGTSWGTQTASMKPGCPSRQTTCWHPTNKGLCERHSKMTHNIGERTEVLLHPQIAHAANASSQAAPLAACATALAGMSPLHSDNSWVARILLDDRVRPSLQPSPTHKPGNVPAPPHSLARLDERQGSQRGRGRAGLSPRCYKPGTVQTEKRRTSPGNLGNLGRTDMKCAKDQCDTAVRSRIGARPWCVRAARRPAVQLDETIRRRRS